MFTIVIGDGLTNEFLSPEVRFQTRPLNVGRQEIDRLMGAGPDFGNGVLPCFLRAVAGAGRQGSDTVLLLLRSAEAGAVSEHQDGDGDFVEPLQDISGAVQVIDAAQRALTLGAFRQAVERLTGCDPVAEETDRSGIRFLLLGCDTENRILALATFLRSVLGYKNVAVSPHLVGSATKDAHFSALRHNFPRAGIEVFVDLDDAARFVGIDPAPLSEFSCRPCIIDPLEARQALGAQQRAIIEYLCMHWTRTNLKPLQGGFSGSLLFLADGWKNEARTEPLVIKIDRFAQMRREIDGYQQVFDYFGKHVPTFGNPVAVGDYIGIAMELAAMDGRPETIQDSFQRADSEHEVRHFMGRLDKALELISDKLYRNTGTLTRIAPYRRFHLHTDQQLQWLRENVDHIVSYRDAASGKRLQADCERIEKILKLIASNEDAMESEACIAHGDLNLKNVICDQGDNIWFIDWTHCGLHPVEMDFAKLENDIKFVVSNHFDLDDLARLEKFEEYLLSQRMPAEAGSLPDGLKFAKWDLRFRKILDAVRKIRETCFSLKSGDDWLVYRTALLKYALHTLSFDQRRDQGECDLPQLLYALISIDGLVFTLVADDFHLKIRGERPDTYPPRLRVPIDEAPWDAECPDYAPPYHVDPSVLSNDRTQKAGGWADPEIAESPDAAAQDDAGPALNPRGRTGIAGRGLLGRWGPSSMVGAVVVRAGATLGELDILLGRIGEGGEFSLPKGFVASNETGETAMARVLEGKIGWRPEAEAGEVVFEGYNYDARQTDHAWIEIQARLFHLDDGAGPARFHPGGNFEEVEWRHLDAKIVNRLPSDQAHLIRAAVERLRGTGRIEKAQAVVLLARTG